MLSKASNLAIEGGKRSVTGDMLLYNTIGRREADAAHQAVMTKLLSGYLAGDRKGGCYVNALEEAWAQLSGARHAVAVNSATSGMLIACMAAGVGRDTIVNCPSYTMSGSVAPAVILGARVNFLDIDPGTYCIPDNKRYSDVTISVGLFGHSPYAEGRFVIQDNAQAVLAKHGNAAVSVYSLNVHKQIQAGEGGICVTNDEDLAFRLQCFRNHGEVSSYNIGLNLRMTEVTAAIALAQLKKAEFIMADRIATAEAVTYGLPDVSWLWGPHILQGCSHSYYHVPIRIRGRNRKRFVEAMNAEGVPLVEGYQTPLHRLEAFSHFPSHCPNTEELEDKELILYPNCTWNPSGKQLKQFKQAFEKVAEHADRWQEDQ